MQKKFSLFSIVPDATIGCLNILSIVESKGPLQSHRANVRCTKCGHETTMSFSGIKSHSIAKHQFCLNCRRVLPEAVKRHRIKKSYTHSNTEINGWPVLNWEGTPR